MCGIVGAISTARLALLDDPTRRDAAIDCLAHRGPDGRGLWLAPDQRAFLGHRRLSIIDVSGGAQPLSNETNTLHFCYNGEIYNFRALRSSLESRGHTFRTLTDGEVCVHQYEDRPQDFETTLRGMFALALIDERAETLVLARDRLGIKPLFFSLSRDTLLFASELKAIIALCGTPPEIDRSALREYLKWKYIPAPRTIYRGVYELPPGSRLVAQRSADGKLMVRASRYWSPDPAPLGPRDETQLIDELDRQVRAAVECHLESDVEVGALLSGGVDSSLIVSIAAQLSKRRIKTFCVGFREEGFDQLPFARTLAEKCGTQHFEQYAELDPQRSIPRLVDSFDQPFADSSALACLAVCETAAKHVKVALTGDGGDEIFCGYQRHADMLAAADGRGWPRIAARLTYPLLSGVFSAEAKFLRRMRAARLGTFEAYDDRERTGSDWLIDRLVGTATDEDALPPQLMPFEIDAWRVNGVHPANAVDAVQHRDTLHYLPGDILQKVDRTSMACGLECRPPLLDHKLVEFALTIPAADKLAGGEPKHLLKKLAERYVPHELIYRKKRGFRVPIRRWLKSGFLADAERQLLSGRCVETGLLNRAATAWVLSRQKLPWFNLSSLIWSLLMLEHWARKRA